MYANCRVIRSTAMVAALAALASIGAAGERKEVSGQGGIGYGREAMAIAEKLNAATTTPEEKEALWAELNALPSSPGEDGFRLAPGPEGETGLDPSVEALEPDGELVLTTRKGNVFSGDFGRAGSWVSFNSTVGKSGDAVVRLELNGHALDMRFTAKSELVRLDGHGYALSVEDKEALRALLRELLRNGVVHGDGPSTTSENWLFRIVNLWSDAPVGWPFDPMQFVRPTSPSTSKGGPSNYFVYPYDNITWTFGWHDGADGHYTNHYTGAGRCAPACLGQCGFGCFGPVFYDGCVQHDVCARSHDPSSANPFNADCSDEWTYAAQGYAMQNNINTNCTTGTGLDHPFWGSGRVVMDLRPDGYFNQSYPFYTRGVNVQPSSCSTIAYLQQWPWTVNNLGAIPCTQSNWVFWVNGSGPWQNWHIQLRAVGLPGGWGGGNQVSYSNQGYSVR